MGKFIIGIIYILLFDALSAQCVQLTTQEANFCGAASPTLKVSNTSSTCPYNWYDAEKGGKKVGTGCDFITPVITCDRSYFVEDTSAIISNNFNAGYPVTLAGKTGTWNANLKSTFFNTSNPMTINSVTVKYKQQNFSCSGDYLGIQFRDANGTISNYPLTPGCGNGIVTEVIPVNFQVSKGVGHEIKITGAENLVYYYNTGADYSKGGPLDFSEGLWMTSNKNGGSAYGAFFDWNLTVLEFCPRKAVQAIQTCVVPEICNNGVDDNCDGLIDYFDPTCNTQAIDEGFYFGQPKPDCQVIPPVDPNFGLEEVWRSDKTVQTRGTPAVGDIDGDGLPEVISYNTADVNNSNLYIFSGLDGSTEVQIPTEIDAMSQSASIADTDGDGLGEIYIVDIYRNLLCFENDGTSKPGFVNTKIGSGTNGSDAPENSYHPAFADFDGDGVPEIYIANQIFSSLTGALLAEPIDQINSSKGGSGDNPIHAYPAAWDILPDDFCTDCSGTELICGDVVYSVNLATGLLTEASKVPPYSNVSDGKTALADWDGDGEMDIIVTTGCCGFGGSIYIWDPRKKEYLTQDAAGNPLVGNPVDAQPSGNSNTGNPSIADFDGDGLLEIAYAGENEYIVMDNDLSIKWTKSVIDKSNMTTSTAFDFEGDGKTEIVYRDEEVLYVFNGETGAVKAQTPCGSGTRTEQPIVVDVDGDGDAEIVCTCSDINEGGQGEVRVFHSNTNDWVNTRSVWHQHNYAPVYINDDLSIPRNFQNKGLLPNQDLFFAQTPVVDVNGEPIFTGLPDITATIDSVVFADCADTDGTAYVAVCNEDLIALVYDFDLSFYEGDPKFGGTYLNTIAVKDENWEATNNRCIQVPITIPNRDYQLHVYINDDGSDPVNAPTQTFDECDLTNNLATSFVNCALTCTPPSTIPSFITSSPINQCATINELLTVTEESGYFFQWYLDGLEITAPTVDQNTLTVASLGHYKVRLVDDPLNINNVSCYVESNELIIECTTCTPPIYSFLTADTSFCAGESGKIRLDLSGTAPYKLYHTSSTDGIQIITDITTNYFEIPVIESQIITIDSLVDQNCVNKTANSVTVSLNPLPNVDLGNDTILCQGDKLILDAENVGASFSWGTTEISQTIVVTTANTYSVVVTDLKGCLSYDTVDVSFNPLPKVDLGADINECAGVTVTLDAQNTGVDFEWNTGETNQTIDVISSDTLNVKVTDFDGCKSIDTVIVTIHPQPVVDLGGDETICTGDTLLIHPHIDGFVYLWSNTETSQSIKINAGGIYELTVSDSSGTCSDSDDKEVFVQSLPLVSLGDDVVTCEGTITTLNAQNTGLDYKWNTSDLTQTIEVGVSGIYYVLVTDALGCKGIDTINVTVQTRPSLDLGDDVTICEGDSLVIDAQNIGFNYDWNTGETTQTIKVKSAGVYEVEVFGSGVGCSDKVAIEVFIQTSPVVDLGDDVFLCKGEEKGLNAKNSGLIFKWSTGVTSQEIIVKETGSYTVTVIDGIGCIGSDTVEVTVYDLPAISIDMPNHICLLDDKVSITTSPFGGLLSGKGISGNQFDPQSIEVTPSIINLITYQYTDVNNCTSEINTTVTVQNEPIVPQDLPDTIICIGEAAMYFLSISDATNFFWFNENNTLQSTENQLYVSESGFYQVEVSNAYCSTLSNKFEVTVISPELSVSLEPNESVMLGESVLLSIDNPNEYYQYIWSLEGVEVGQGSYFEAYPSTSINYDVTAKFKTCEISSSLEVEVIQPIIIPSMFTPNGDGLNDVWEITGLDSGFNFDLKVYNRWGSVVYQEYKFTKYWDGTIKGKPIPAAVYYYVLTTPNNKIYQGSVSIVR